MIQKVVHKRNLQELSEVKENLAYWLSRQPEERIDAVERLRRERHGNEQRLQRVARVIQRS